MIEHILQRFRDWEHLGVLESAEGSRLIGHTPRDYPQAYLHSFFAPLPESAWQGYGVTLSTQLAQLYQACNGLRLFGGTLTIWGIRAHYKRDTSAQFQPFDLAKHHMECIHSYHRTVDAKRDDRLFFGSYHEDGSHIYTTAQGPDIYRVLRGSSEPVNSWSDLQRYLSTEYDRIGHLFTSSGYLVVDDARTTPECEST